MKTRAAASPRSASPIGPAPTRLPRIALPPATVSDSSLLWTLPVHDNPGTRVRHAATGWTECTHGPRRAASARLDCLLLEQQPEPDDGGDPEDRSADRQPVEVLLDDRRAAERGRD